MAIVRFNFSSTSFDLAIEDGVTFNLKDDGWYYHIEKYNIEHQVQPCCPFIQSKDDFKNINTNDLAYIKNNLDYILVEDCILDEFISWLCSEHLEKLNLIQSNINNLKNNFINTDEYSLFLKDIYDCVLNNELLKICGVATVEMNDYLFVSEDSFSFPMDYDYHQSTFDSLENNNISISYKINKGVLKTYIHFTSLCELEEFIEVIKKGHFTNLENDYEKLSSLIF